MNSENLFLCLFGILAYYIAGNLARLQGEGIIEGDEAKPNQFPYQVAIKIITDSNCGGGIIGDRHILTAAHCVIDDNGEFYGVPLVIHAGMNDVDDDEAVKIYVKKIYVSSLYQPINGSLIGDIAVLKLKDSLNISENPKLKSLKLPENEEETFVKKEVTIAGYGWSWINVRFNPFFGDLEEDGGRNNTKLRFLTADVVGHKECQEIYHDKKVIDKTQICAQAKQRDPKNPSGICSGDSGGPLVYNGETVIGIVSSSPIGCRENKLPAIYTNVSAYLDFIKKAINDEDSDENIRHFIFTQRILDEWEMLSKIIHEKSEGKN